MKNDIQQPVDNKPDIWSAKEVSIYLKLSYKTVYNLAHKGQLPCTFLGKTLRFSRKKIESLV
jgi:excisionase family DNA binding protein